MSTFPRSSLEFVLSSSTSLPTPVARLRAQGTPSPVSLARISNINETPDAFALRLSREQINGGKCVLSVSTAAGAKPWDSAFFVPVFDSGAVDNSQNVMHVYGVRSVTLNGEQRSLLEKLGTLTFVVASEATNDVWWQSAPIVPTAANIFCADGTLTLTSTGRLEALGGELKRTPGDDAGVDKPAALVLTGVQQYGALVVEIVAPGAGRSAGVLFGTAERAG